MRTQSWKALVKSGVARILYSTGLLQLFVRRRCRDRVVVLTYHRVLSEGDFHRTWSHPGMVVRRQTFETHLQLLRRHFRMLSVEEFATYLRSGTPIPGPCCLITFDDGWVDTFEEAWPALMQHAVPAVVFLPVDVVGSDRPFWQEQLGQALYGAWERARLDGHVRATCEQVLPARLHQVLDAAPERVRDSIYHATQQLKANPDGLDPWDVVNALQHIVGEEPGAVDRLMAWEQVRTMAEGGVVFGGHGATHRILTSLPIDAASSEIVRSAQTLEHELGQRPVAFAYPNGDWNPPVAGEVRRTGYQIAFSTTPGRVSAAEDPLAIRRINVSESTAATAPLLLLRMAGLI